MQSDDDGLFAFAKLFFNREADQSRPVFHYGLSAALHKTGTGWTSQFAFAKLLNDDARLMIQRALPLARRA
jgi:hypothetical protein